MLRQRTRGNKKGMTLPEVLISAVIGMLLVGIILSMWFFAYKNWSMRQVETKFRIDLEKALERIKHEIRLSSATFMSLYKPAGDTDYKAISFPMATPDGNGFFTLDTATGYIEWDKSVIYHIFDDPVAGTVELRRTEFENNNAVLAIKTQREVQLASVYANGDGSMAPNAANATTRAIIKDVERIDFKISPTDLGVDLYSPTTKRSDNIQFGGIRLDPGAHDFTFEVVGKNDDSTGHAFGIDTLSITPSGCRREAEYFTPVASSGDGYTKIYAQGWSGDNYAEYGSGAVDDFVTLELEYDLWRESNFENSMRDNTVIDGNDLVARLAYPREGARIFWQESNQTGSETPSVEAFNGLTVRNILMSDFITSGGASVRAKFQAPPTKVLNITAVYITERYEDDDATGASTAMHFGGSTGASIPAGGNMWSDWENFEVDASKDYFITFAVGSICPDMAYWQDQDGKADSYGLVGTGDVNSNVWSGSAAYSRIYAVEALEDSLLGVIWSASGAVSGQTKTENYQTQSFGLSIRNILTNDCIDETGDLIRFKFVASGAELPITAAYIVERVEEDDGTRPFTNLTSAVTTGDNTVTVGSTADFPGSGFAYIDDPDDDPDDHMRPFNYTGTTAAPSASFTGASGIVRDFSSGDPVKGEGISLQLYFSDPAVPNGEDEPDGQGFKVGNDGGAASASVTVPGPDGGAPDGYYVYSNWVAFAIDTAKDYFVTLSLYDVNSDAITVSYWEGEAGSTNSYYQAGRLCQDDATWNGSNDTRNIYALELGETWSGTGTITSAIYDTKIENPAYNNITWDGTTGSGMSMKARSSDNEDMSGVTDWSLIGGSSNPGGLGIGSGRYVQFQATLTKTGNFDNLGAYPWIDNVAIDWPGEARMCEISGYFTEKANYGIIKLLVDGEELTKGLETSLTVSDDFQGEAQEASLTVEVEPLNTGK